MHVMIVDRCPLVGALLALDLGDYGVQTRAVNTIAQATVEISKNQPDVLITELFLKDGDFLDLVCYRELFPIILFTTHPTSVDDDDIRKAVDACLQKPLNPIHLLTAAKKLVAQQKMVTTLP
uniref:Response regulator receiver protein n=1 Tax=Cyanothece sp. (strain PCC 7425 / ATCC 29141) TaxID=395961 RepID=B8HWG8_CYAP4